MQRIDNIVKYIGNDAVKEKITSEHIKTTSLIRSSLVSLWLKVGNAYGGFTGNFISHNPDFLA